MENYIVILLISLVVTGGAYIQDALPSWANDAITKYVPYAEELKSEPEQQPQETAPPVQQPEEDIDEPMEITEDSELSQLQQEAINKSEQDPNRIKITYGRVQITRDCTSDIDCLKAYPEAGIEIQCSSEGLCYKFSKW